MTDRKKGRDLESQLEWYYVSTQTLVRIVVGFLVVAGLVASGVFFFVKRDDSARRARQEVADAEDALTRAKKQQDAGLLQREIAAADDKLADAHRDLDIGQNERATKTALDVKSTALKIMAGAVIKSEAHVADVAGTVQIQRANRTTWETLRQSMPLHEGDFIKTGPNGTAEVLWNDGTMYRIRPETLFEVHGAAGGSNPKLVVGTTDVSTGDKSTSKVSTDVATANIDSNSMVGMQQDASATSVSSYRGRTVLSNAAGQSVTLGARERAVAARGGPIGPKITLPDVPNLLAPDDNLLVDLRKSEPLRLKWSPVKEASGYQVEIAASRLFVKDSVLPGFPSERVQSDTLLQVHDPGLYFWHVRTVKKGSPVLYSEWTAERRFKAVGADQAAVQGDALPPDLVITQRPNVVGSSVVLVGRTVPGALVTVNGEMTDVNADGSFRKIITIGGDGMQTIVIKARTAGGETVKRETVLISN
jgi:type II secretory pathway pseudopilin PulG